MSARPDAPRVRIKTSAAQGEFLAFVDTGATETRVRFRRSDVGNQWRCDACGSHRFSTCTHEIAARRAWQHGGQTQEGVNR